MSIEPDIKVQERGKGFRGADSYLPAMMTASGANVQVQLVRAMAPKAWVTHRNRPTIG